jgi:AGCS family alanine or glycine:cation symporter
MYFSIFSGKFIKSLEMGEMCHMILQKIGDFVWGWPMMGLFLGVGVFFMLRLRGFPFRYLGRALKSIGRKGEGNGLSSYGALCTALAATIGTGNIVGVATAVSAGGPGALLWMVFAAAFGMATQYSEGYLAVRYRRRTKEGFFGGPFCYMELGLGRIKMGRLFAFLGASAGLLGVGTLTQVNSITTAVDSFFPTGNLLGDYSSATVVSGILVLLLSAAVLLGGAKRISKVCEMLVPLMSAIYLLCALILLCRFWNRIPAAVGLILRSALRPRAVLGAGMGIGLKQAMRMGIGRGVFTNEAGLGTSPIAAAASNTRDPVTQGLVTMTGTFIDTIVICTVTGLCLVVTGAWKQPLQGVELTDYAWRMGLPWGERFSSFLLLICLVFFAFATIIGWSFYAEQCLRYLTGGRGLRLYRMGYLLAIAVGPYLTVGAVWELADIFNALLALPNLTALLLLQGEVVSGTRG